MCSKRHKVVLHDSMTLFTFAGYIQEGSYQCQSNSDKTPSIWTDELLFIYMSSLHPKLAEQI